MRIRSFIARCDLLPSVSGSRDHATQMDGKRVFQVDEASAVWQLPCV